MKSVLLYRQKSRRRPRNGTAAGPLRIAETDESCAAVAAVLNDLPDADNEAGAVEKMLRANGLLRNLPWPSADGARATRPAWRHWRQLIRGGRYGRLAP